MQEFRINIKKLWHVINTCIGKQSDKTNIINYIKVGNINIYDSKQIADEMDYFFSTIGSNYAIKIPAPNNNIKDYLKVISGNVRNIFFMMTNHDEVRNLKFKLPNKKVVVMTILIIFF